MKKSRQSACVPDRPRYIAVHIHNYIHRKRVGKGKEVGRGVVICHMYK